MNVQLTWTDCDEAGDYVLPNVLSPRDLVSRPDNMEETELHFVQSLYFLNPKFQASIQFFCMYSLVCVGPDGNPEDRLSGDRANIKLYTPCSMA